MAGPLRFDSSSVMPVAAQRALLACVLRRARAYTGKPGRGHVGVYAMRVSGYGRAMGYSLAWGECYNIASQDRYLQAAP